MGGGGEGGGEGGGGEGGGGDGGGEGGGGEGGGEGGSKGGGFGEGGGGGGKHATGLETHDPPPTVGTDTVQQAALLHQFAPINFPQSWPLLFDPLAAHL